MADVPQTLSLITLAQMFRGDVVEQINRRVSLLKLVRITPGSGKNVAWAPESDGALAENYAEGADAANFGSDAQASAILTWGLYRSNFHVTNLAMDSASSSVDPLGNRTLWVKNIKNAAAKLAATLNAACFNGAGTGTTIAGLDVAIGDDSNTYATIVRGSSAYWRPTVVDPGVSTAPTQALIRDDIRKVYEACGETPDVAVCAPAVFNAIGALFDATRRQVQDISRTLARGAVSLEFGLGALEVDGTVFYRDKDATANRIYYLNTSKMELQYLPSAAQTQMLMDMGMQVQADDGFGEVPLGFTYELLAKTGPASKAEVLFTGQLVVERPNAFGVRKNVAA